MFVAVCMTSRSLINHNLICAGGHFCGQEVLYAWANMQLLFACVLGQSMIITTPSHHLVNDVSSGYAVARFLMDSPHLGLRYHRGTVELRCMTTRRLMDFSHPVDNKSVLDFACGCGVQGIIGQCPNCCVITVSATRMCFRAQILTHPQILIILLY